MPVVDERDGRGRGFADFKIDQESLAVGRYSILLIVKARQRTAGNANREQGRRSPGFQRLAIRRQLHRGSHHLAVQGNIKDLFAVLIPPGLRSTVGRDLKLPARSWKRLDVNLKPSRFVRLVRDPLA